MKHPVGEDSCGVFMLRFRIVMCRIIIAALYYSMLW